MTDSAAPSPLHGIQVLDFGQYLAGPAAAMILADLGADVIRIDPPAGPRWEAACVRVLNRNKKSITLNLKDSQDRAAARALIAGADVVVENFRPKVMGRLGLGAQEMLARNPRLVYLSLPGFSGTDAELADVQAWEGVVAAAVGQFTDMGLNRVLMGVDPSFSPLLMASSYAAVLGALAVVIALRARERDGQGDVIEVPLAAALSEGLAYNSMHVEGLPRRYLSLREREIEHRRQSGDPLDLTYGEVHRLPGRVLSLLHLCRRAAVRGGVRVERLSPRARAQTSRAMAGGAGCWAPDFRPLPPDRPVACGCGLHRFGPPFIAAME